MYGGSNEVFGKNENFPLVLDIKLHLKIPVNYQLQISPPPTQVFFYNPYVAVEHKVYLANLLLAISGYF